MSIIETSIETLASVQTEIAIFLVALLVHALVFGRHRLAGKKGSGAKGAAKRIIASSKPSKDPSKPPSTQAPGVLALARQVKALVREDATQATIANALDEQLEKKSAEDTVTLLSGVLEQAGKSASPALLSAVHTVLQTRGLGANNRLGEALLRGFLFLKKQEQFDKVLAEVEGGLENGTSMSPGVSSLALRAAIFSSNFEEALYRLPSFAATCQQQANGTPSASPQQLMQHFVQLAAEKGQVTRLLQELCNCGLFTPWMVETLLAVCAQKARDQAEVQAAFEKTLELARSRGVELTAGARATLIRRSRSAGDARSLLAEATTAGCSPEVLLAAAVIAEAQGDAGLAGDVLRMLPEKLPVELAAAALRLAGATAGKDADDTVLKLYEERLVDAVDILADASAGLLVASAALRQERHDLLQKLLGACVEQPRQVALLKRLGAKHGLQDARAIFKACPTKTTCLCNALLDVCIESGHVQAAELIMKEAKGAGLADVITYNTMIKAQLQNGDTKRARATIETMRTAGLEPNVVTFNELIDETLKQHNRHGAWDIIEEMKACAVHPNQVTCSILLKSIQKSSRSSDLERTLAIMDTLECEMDEVLLSSVCEACIRSNRPGLLLQQLKHYRECKGVRVAGPHTFGSIIRAYGFVKDMAGVWQTWKDMRSRHILPTSITLGCMVEALVTNDGPDAGHSLISEVIEDAQMRPLLNAVIYCSVLKGFSHEKRFGCFWSVHEEMVKEKLEFSITTYNTLIDACARSCEMARVPKFLEEMKALKIEPNVITYSTILKGYCQENRLDQAFDLLEDMKKTKQFMPDEITYNTLLDGCARHGLVDRGLAVLKDMQAGGVRPSNFTLSVLVKLANRANKPELAFELCRDLSREYNLVLNTHVYNNLMHACTQHWDLPRALNVFQQLLQERARPDVRTYRILLQGCTAAGEGKGAADLLRAATGLAQEHPKLTGFAASALRPSETLPGDLVSEVLEDIAGKCGDEGLAMQLFQDVKRVPGMRLNPRLNLSLTNKAIRAPARR
jgi:pentatricopeptide repeat protein